MSRVSQSVKNLRFGRAFDNISRAQAPLDIAKRVFAKALSDYTEINESRQQFFISQISTMDKARFMHMPTLAAVFAFMDRYGIIPKDNVKFLGEPTTPGTVAYNIYNMTGVITPSNIDPYINSIPEYNKHRSSKKRKSKVLTDENIRVNFYSLFIRYMFEIVSTDRVEPPEEIVQSTLATAKEQAQTVKPGESDYIFSYELDSYKPVDDDDLIEQENDELDMLKIGGVPIISKQQIAEPSTPVILPPNLGGSVPLPSFLTLPQKPLTPPSVPVPLPSFLTLPQKPLILPNVSVTLPSSLMPSTSGLSLFKPF